MIIGLTGTNASGKGSAADYLREKGFRTYSLSDELRYLMRKRKIPTTRENFIKYGRYFREKHGNGYLAKKAIARIKGYAVIDSIRNPGEIAELRKNKNFFLISFDAPVKIRFERSRKRGSKRDEKTLAEFIAKEKEELRGKGSSQQILACMAKADFKVNTKEGYAKLYKKLDDILTRLGYDSKR